MVVPFSNRAAVATLPALALAKGPATVKEVIDDFANQCQPFSSVLECVQLVKGRTLRIHFPNADVREDITSGGLTFRGHPLAFTVPTTFKWVSILDLPYGTPDGEISSSLSKFGQVASIRPETYKGLYTGTKLVKCALVSDVVSLAMRLRSVPGRTQPCLLPFSRQIRTLSGPPRPRMWTPCPQHRPRALAPLRVLSRGRHRRW